MKCPLPFAPRLTSLKATVPVPRAALPALVITVILTTLIGFIVVGDYARESDFLRFQLARNLNAGHGMVYAPGNHTLLSASPGGVVLAALSSDQAMDTAAFVSVIAWGAIAGLTANLLAGQGFTALQTAVAAGIWSLSWPLWVGFRGAEALAALVILIAITLIKAQRPAWAGLAAGTAPLLHPLGIAGLLAVIVYTGTLKRRRGFWGTVWLPVAAWMTLSLVTYGTDSLAGLTLTPMGTSGDWRDLLWLFFFGAASWVLLRRKTTDVENGIFLRWLPLWATLEIGGLLLVNGQLPVLSGLATALAVGAAAGYLVSLPGSGRGLAFIATGIAALLIVAAPPQLADDFAADRDLARSLDLPPGASIGHAQSDAFTYFAGLHHVDRLDGQRDLRLHHMIQRGDTASALVFAAPDFVLAREEDASVTDAIFSSGARALGYTQVSGDLWQREASIVPFMPVVPSGIAYGPDITLTGYALDRERVEPGEVLRLRLDWSLARPPEEAITLNLSLIDVNGSPAVTVFQTIEQSAWASLTPTTYHALRLPDGVSFGVQQVSVSVDYRAALLGRADISRVLVPMQALDAPSGPPVGTLGPVTLHGTTIRSGEGAMQVVLVWSTSERLDRDYRVFVHLTPLNDLQPLAQDDGLPLAGRYPTGLWLPGEIVSDARRVPLADVPPGRYRVNVGLYTPETGRLSGPAGDFLTVAEVELEAEGTLNVIDTAP